MTEIIAEGISKLKMAVGVGSDSAAKDKDAVPAPTSPAATPAAGDDKADKARGIVEDVIVRRLRPLNKKIQRIRAYTDQDLASLNADQRKAVASLPELEGRSRELEELSKQVEEAELVAASRAREVREADQRANAEAAQAKIVAAQIALATPLSHFLKLHALLFPGASQPADLAQLTFTSLELPLRLRDEVEASDIRRVGQMYAALLGGGAEGAQMLAGLAEGANGVDEENDHVHHLMALLTLPSERDEPATPVDPETVSVAVEPALSDADGLSTSQIPTLAGSPVGTPTAMRDTLDADVVSTASGLPATMGARPPVALNFLQEDELAPATLPAAAPAPAPEPAEQPALPPAPAPAPAFAVSEPAFDWADEDAAGDLTAEQIRQAFAAGPAEVVTETTVADPVGEPAIALVQETDGAAPDAPVEVPTSVETPEPVADDTAAPSERAERGKGGRGRARGQRKPSRGGRGQGPRLDRADRPERQERPNRTERAIAAAQPAQGVDSDGFETVANKRPAPAARGHGTGRGGLDRGRGGRGRGGARTVSTRDGTGSADGAKDTPQPAAKAPELAPPVGKKSIYKTTQPSGPTSAPIF
ncbi:hypothetical protein Q5752_006166 [Cryptotrichosporon argae]